MSIVDRWTGGRARHARPLSSARLSYIVSRRKEKETTEGPDMRETLTVTCQNASDTPHTNGKTYS